MQLIVRSNLSKFGETTSRKIKVNSAEEGKEILRLCGNIFIQRTQEEAPTKSGRLKKSIGATSGEGIYEWFSFGNTVGLRIGTKVPYARAVNEGIPSPYEIRPKDKKVLAFETTDIQTENIFRKYKGTSPVEKVFRPFVIHPATKGKFFMQTGLILMRREFPSIVKQARANVRGL